MSIPTRGLELTLDRLVVRGHDVYEGQNIVNTIETTLWAGRLDFTGHGINWTLVVVISLLPMRRAFTFELTRLG